MQYLNDFIDFVVSLYRRLVGACRSLTTPSVERVIKGFESQIAALDAATDLANEQASTAIARRQSLRAQIAKTHDEENAAFARARRASGIRKNLENIVNV